MTHDHSFSTIKAELQQFSLQRIGEYCCKFEVSPLFRCVVLEISIENGFNGLKFNNYYIVYIRCVVAITLTGCKYTKSKLCMD